MGSPMEAHKNENASEAKQHDRERAEKDPRAEHSHSEAGTGDGKEVRAGSVPSGKSGAAHPHGGGKSKPRKNNLRRLRLERMMSKAELARRAGVSTLTIDRVERGMSCRMDTKRKILEALGLKPSDRVTVFGEDE
jgi:DNA-binding XRE family transcriptional regulator